MSHRTPAPLTDLARCAIHTMTHKPWTLRQCCDHFAAAGVGGISVWRNTVEPAQGGVGTAEAARILKDSGLVVPALVRGGFFVSADASKREAAVDESRRCVEMAAALGAEMIVLVVGAEPGVPLNEARQQVTQGIADTLPDAQAAGVKLAIEPLHPMYAADKSCVNRMAEARAICQTLGHPSLGIAVDVYHVWWDPDVEVEIERAGELGLIFGFHVCDWRVDTHHLLTDRGLMGDGCIDIRRLRGLVEATGFTGFNEVEVFSEHYWAMDQGEYLERIVAAYHGNT